MVGGEILARCGGRGNGVKQGMKRDEELAMDSSE
jgi:hypothetical protein